MSNDPRPKGGRGEASIPRDTTTALTAAAGCCPSSTTPPATSIGTTAAAAAPAAAASAGGAPCGGVRGTKEGSGGTHERDGRERRAPTHAPQPAAPPRVPRLPLPAPLLLAAALRPPFLSACLLLHRRRCCLLHRRRCCLPHRRRCCLLLHRRRRRAGCQRALCACGREGRRRGRHEHRSATEGREGTRPNPSRTHRRRLLSFLRLRHPSGLVHRPGVSGSSSEGGGRNGEVSEGERGHARDGLGLSWGPRALPNARRRAERGHTARRHGPPRRAGRSASVRGVGRSRRGRPAGADGL